jgi:hypothetical protein
MKMLEGPKDLWSIRIELLVRIAIQNLTLLTAVATFIYLMGNPMIHGANLWTIATVYGIASFALALQWCHSGVRTMQIKKYILLVENGKQDTWERWLPVNRPLSFLGTRWVISTKGVFLGLQMASGVIAAITSPASDPFWIIGWGTALLTSAWFLFSNPKESL